MNSGDSVQDVSRTGLDDAGGFGAAAGQDSGQQSRSLWTGQPLQDIQDLIDQLAAVNQELRRPASKVASPSN